MSWGLNDKSDVGSNAIIQKYTHLKNLCLAIYIYILYCNLKFYYLIFDTLSSSLILYFFLKT